MRKRIFFLLAALGMAGCTHGTQPQDYGGALPPDYRKQIEKKFVTTSVTDIILQKGHSVFEFWPPVKTSHERQDTNRNVRLDKGYYVVERKTEYGWLVCGKLLRHDSLSGYNTYDGPQPFFVMFRDGKMVEAVISRTMDESMNHVDRKYIYNTCTAAGMPRGKTDMGE